MHSLKKLQKVCEKLRKIQSQRNKLLRLFYQHKRLIIGCYGETSICCGQPSCRCHRQGGHYATRLSRWVGKKLKTQIIRVKDREWVKLASENYKNHKNALKNITTLSAKEVALLKHIIELKNDDYE